MSDWASGIVDVTGTKASIEAFLNRFIYNAEPPTVPGVRYFARSVLYESRDKIQEELDSVFWMCRKAKSGSIESIRSLRGLRLIALRGSIP